MCVGILNLPCNALNNSEVRHFTSFLVLFGVLNLLSGVSQFQNLQATISGRSVPSVVDSVSSFNTPRVFCTTKERTGVANSSFTTFP